MPEPKIRIQVRRLSAEVSAMDVQGELTSSAEEALMAAYSEAATEGTKFLVLNFAELDYMNSSGIGLIVTLLIRANRQGQQLRALGLTEHYRHIFHLTRLDEAIPFIDDESEAMAAAK